MNRNIWLGIALLAALPSLTASAGEPVKEETVTKGDVLITETVQGEAERSPVRKTDRKLPVRGMDMANVENVFGPPAEKHAPVGEPPITRWDYDGYSVFFEYDKVLHTVVTE